MLIIVIHMNIIVRLPPLRHNMASKACHKVNHVRKSWFMIYIVKSAACRWELGNRKTAIPRWPTPPPPKRTHTHTYTDWHTRNKAHLTDGTPNLTCTTPGWTNCEPDLTDTSLICLPFLSPYLYVSRTPSTCATRLKHAGGNGDVKGFWWKTYRGSGTEPSTMEQTVASHQFFGVTPGYEICAARLHFGKKGLRLKSVSYSHSISLWFSYSSLIRLD